ncbi:hypothetical protein [Streptomyces sp. NPDC088789]|uniref:hypothetical protein n=1 Tax=Streptomyces sp. NPDC088789 TaxID=3365899 RepID=UPI0037F16B1A
MTTDQSLVRIYSDRTYTFTTMVRHQGTVIAFALDSNRRIVYSVLDLSTHDEGRGVLDTAYWTETPTEVPFPNEMTQAGYAIVGATAMPRVKRVGRVEAEGDEDLADEETDPFLSTTARLTGPGVPFQVLSDGTSVVILRQAIDRGHADALFLLNDGGCSGDTSRTDLVADSTGVKVPVVDGTLLCDRFLLVGGTLKPTAEVRFRRSRHKSEPESAKDSLGATDMDGTPLPRADPGTAVHPQSDRRTLHRGPRPHGGTGAAAVAVLRPQRRHRPDRHVQRRAGGRRPLQHPGQPLLDQPGPEVPRLRF